MNKVNGVPPHAHLMSPSPHKKIPQYFSAPCYNSEPNQNANRVEVTHPLPNVLNPLMLAV